jgi:hypothetical protein
VNAGSRQARGHRVLIAGHSEAKPERKNRNGAKTQLIIYSIPKKQTNDSRFSPALQEKMYVSLNKR